MKYLESLLISIFAVFAPIKAVLIVVGILIFSDLITGIIAAYKRGEAISSAGLRRSIVKLFLYQMVVLTAFLVETYLLSSMPIVKLVSGVIGSTELLSILENVNESTNGKIFSNIISLLKSKNDTK